MGESTPGRLFSVAVSQGALESAPSRGSQTRRTSTTPLQEWRRKFGTPPILKKGKLTMPKKSSREPHGHSISGQIGICREERSPTPLSGKTSLGRVAAERSHERSSSILLTGALDRSALSAYGQPDGARLGMASQKGLAGPGETKRPSRVTSCVDMDREARECLPGSAADHFALQ
jgi:hypothetical protein